MSHIKRSRSVAHQVKLGIALCRACSRLSFTSRISSSHCRSVSVGSSNRTARRAFTSCQSCSLDKSAPRRSLAPSAPQSSCVDGSLFAVRPGGPSDLSRSAYQLPSCARYISGTTTRVSRRFRSTHPMIWCSLSASSGSATEHQASRRADLIRAVARANSGHAAWETFPWPRPERASTLA